MGKLLQRLVLDERGGEVIDYVLVLGLIVIGALLLIGTLGTRIKAKWSAITNAL